jgi:AcrR family transcriptional regulator
MSSTVDNDSSEASPATELAGARRGRDSEATRAALLRAARSAFDELGYDLATTREIGERAGVDPALIARYFDSKEGLFLASIAYVAEDDGEYEYDVETLVGFLLERWDEHGHNPLSRALASLGLSDGMRRRVATVVRDRLRAQLGAELEARGVPDCEMRAELLVAIAVGVSITRANGTLEALAAADRGSVLAALEPAIAALVSPPPR